MRIIDRGAGLPVVLVPGIQGRWEWMAPAVEALARRCRIVTFSLADEPTSRARCAEPMRFSRYVDQIREVLDARGIDRATLCGISYGGLVAAAAAAQIPERVSALVLGSALPPSWTPDRRVRLLVGAPRLLAPLFCLNSLRLVPEMVTARGGVVPGLAFGLRHVWAVLTHPFSPSLMARRVRLLEGLELEAGMRRVAPPTLVITGEAELDRVVPVPLTRRYREIWPHARLVTLERTGHLGSLTRADEFAALVTGFAAEASTAEDRRRRIG